MNIPIRSIQSADLLDSLLLSSFDDLPFLRCILFLDLIDNKPDRRGLHPYMCRPASMTAVAATISAPTRNPITETGKDINRCGQPLFLVEDVIKPWRKH